MNAGSAEPEPPPWAGPWVEDARRLFQVFQAAAEEIGAEPPLAVLRRAGPEVLDRVSELSAALATALRTMNAEREPGPGPESPSAPAPGGGSASARTQPPSTVRINVTD